jgi:hypothetical protein
MEPQRRTSRRRFLRQSAAISAAANEFLKPKFRKGWELSL